MAIKNMTNKKGFAPIIIIVAVVALVVVGIIMFKVFNGSTSQSTTNVAPASVTNVVLAKGVDAKGNPVGVSTAFNSAKDKQIYVILSLKNATKQTTLGYTRYLNGTFVDSKVMHPTANGVSNVYFAFEKGVGNYPKGNYRIVSYVNGKRSLETTYSFR